MILYQGKSDLGRRAFFQYSLEKDWERKLDRELEKVRRNGHEIATFVFLTTQNVTGNKLDQFQEKARKDYGWDLLIYHREWFRLQLEEINKDLAIKYLGVPHTVNRNREFSEGQEPTIPPAEQNNQAWKLFKQEKYEEAIPKFKELLAENIENIYIINGLSWAYYQLHNYQEALKWSNQSLLLDANLKETRALRGCILAEDGISNSSRIKVLNARDIFLDLVKDSDNYFDYYNLANTLSALNEHETAIKYYEVALKYNEKSAEVWKNLGSAYYNVGNHEKELECFEKALSINPQLIEALISKGMTLAKVFGRYEEAIILIDELQKSNRDFFYRFPNILYWKIKFLININKNEIALVELNNAISMFPDNMPLLDLKAQLLSELWQLDKKYKDEAKSFYMFRIQMDAKEIASLRELAMIYNAENNTSKSMEVLIDLFNLFGEWRYQLNVSDINDINITIEELFLILNHLKSYATYRNTVSIIRYQTLIEQPVIGKHEAVMWIIWGVIYAKAFLLIKQYKRQSQNLKIGDLKHLYRYTRQQFKTYSPRLIMLIGRNYRLVSQEKKIDLLTNMTLAFPEIFLRELSAQVGYLCGVFNIKKELLDSTLNKMKEIGKWMTNDCGLVLTTLNREIELLPEK